jgi:hypothetical protein
MLKTMNASSTTTPAKESQSAGASFFDVLAGTSAASDALSAGSTAGAPASSGRGDSKATAQGGQTNAKTGANNQDLAQNGTSQIEIDLTNQLSALTQPASSQASVRSAANTSSRATDHQQKSQSVSESAAPATTNIALPLELSSTPQTVIAPVPLPALPSSDASAAAADNSRAASLSEIDTTSAVSAAGADKAGVQNSQPETATSRAAGAITANAGKPESGLSSSKTTASGADAQTATQSAEADQSDAANAATQETSNALNAMAAMVLPANPALPGIDIVPGIGDPNQLAGKAAQTGKGSDASLAKLADSSTGASQKSNSESQSSAAGTGASSSSVAGSNQATHQPQADGSQTAPVNSNSGASQIATQINGQMHAQISAQMSAQTQQAASHGTAHDLTAPHNAADSVADAVRAGSQAAGADGAENAGVSPINTANVIQKMSETEMHVGMRSADFGEVSIRTLVSQQQMTAQISVDHGDLGKAISAHIPAMEAKLGGDFGLRAIVEVNQSGMSFSGERGFASQREQKSFAQPAQSQDAATSTEADQPALLGIARTDGTYRLDIRA